MNDSTVTKADLVEEVVRVTELPRKESEAVVETIFESIIGAPSAGRRPHRNPGLRKFPHTAAPRPNLGRKSQDRAPRSRCRRRRFLSSSPARN